MTAYLLRRLGLAVITLWILSMIVFFAGQVELKGTKISISPELGQCRSDLIGTYQSGNGTQVDRKSGLVAWWLNRALPDISVEVEDRPHGPAEVNEKVPAAVS